MSEFHEDPYTTVQTKAKFVKLYGEEITFYNNAKQVTVMVFRQKAEELLDQFYRQPRKDSIEEEKLKVIQLAAQLTLHDISNSKCKVDDDVYLAVSTVDIDLLLNDLPCTLKFFLTRKFHDAIFIVSWSLFAQSVWIKIFSRKAVAIGILQGIP